MKNVYPKISILIAVYNTIEYLPLFFDCLRRQTYKNFEAIFIDDLSTDGSYEYLCEEAKKDNRFIVTRVKEKALPDKARKIGFNMSTGEYIIYLDSDDEFTIDYINGLVNLAVKNDLDFAVSSCQRINEKSEKIGNRQRICKNDCIFNSKTKVNLIKGRYGGWNRMARKEYLEKYKYTFLQAELPLFIMQFYDDAKVGYTDSGCYYYRMRGGSISSSKVPQRIANYDVLEPIDWLQKREINKSLKEALGVYLTRMILPYILYKKAFVSDYDFKKDISYVKKECNYNFFKAAKYFFLLSKRDKFIMLTFMFHWYWPSFYFIKKYRS